MPRSASTYAIDSGSWERQPAGAHVGLIIHGGSGAGPTSRTKVEKMLARWSSQSHAVLHSRVQKKPTLQSDKPSSGRGTGDHITGGRYFVLALRAPAPGRIVYNVFSGFESFPPGRNVYMLTNTTRSGKANRRHQTYWLPRILERTNDHLPRV